MDVLTCAEIGHPVPGEDAFDADDDVFPVRSDGREKVLGLCAQVAVEHDLPALIDDAGVYAAGVEIDASVVAVLFGIEPHRGLLLSGMYPIPVYP